MQFELRKWKVDDVDHIAKCADNEKIAGNLRNTFPHPYTDADAWGYVNACMNSREEEQLCRAIIVEGHAAGSVEIVRGKDIFEKSAELGYWLSEDEWGKGIMTAAVILICREAFLKYDINRIYAMPFADNIGSRRVLEKAGFELEGTMKQGIYKNGEFHDYCIYGILRETMGEHLI